MEDAIFEISVLCNAPTNYVVPFCKGILLAKSCKDLVIKCVTRLTVGTTDRLRVEIMRLGEIEILGTRDILLRTVGECTSPAAQSSSMSPDVCQRDDHGSSSRSSVRIRGEVCDYWRVRTL
ncbi:hypothetical protein COOONC_01078 [Cooperia oncophora]